MNNITENKRILRLLFWESTIRCNLACAHCRRIGTNAAADSDIPAEQARTFIMQLADIGCRQNFMPILVFSGGEPLCRKDIFDLVRFAADKKLNCAMATNGTLINSTIAGQIRSSGIRRVSVSLDGATGAVHNRLRKLEGSFEAALKGIGYLKDAGVEFQINMTVTRYNQHQLDEIFVLAEALGAVAVHLFMLVGVGCGGQLADEEILSPKEYEQVLHGIAGKEKAGPLEVKVTCGPHYQRILRENAEKDSHNADRRPRHQWRGCLAGSGVLFVGHNGDVFPCGYLPIHCGNVLQVPLDRIWNENEDLARLRNIKELKGKCGICEYRFVCGGCRARAYAVFGDYMAQEPSCLYIPSQKEQT